MTSMAMPDTRPYVCEDDLNGIDYADPDSSPVADVYDDDSATGHIDEIARKVAGLVATARPESAACGLTLRDAQVLLGALRERQETVQRVETVWARWYSRETAYVGEIVLTSELRAALRPT